jgi:aminoglycoside phosphotransferase
MTHGYTHLTSRTGDVVTKQYRGPDAATGCAREVAALHAVAGVLPVPRVIATGPAWLQTTLAAGVHGQDLISAGLAGSVLAACGRMLRKIHQLPVPAALSAPALAPGAVLVHGDYGPNNVLLDPDAHDVTAVLDWEWAHAGDPIDDLAWCEFIIRLHHPADIWALAGFYESYGSRPAWPELHAGIIDRCHSMLDFCRRWQPDGAGVASWTQRLATVRTWTH